MTADLVAFLRAQFDAEAQDAENAAVETSRDWVPTSNAVYEANSNAAVAIGPWEYMADAVVGHIARHDPAHVLAEIEAKRRIVRLHEITVEKTDAAPFDSYTGERCRDEYDVTCALCGWVSDDPTAGCLTLRLLAAPYATAEGYRPEWAPDAEEQP